MSTSCLLVGNQLALVGAVLFSGPLWPEPCWLRVLLLAGIGLGGWAILVMKPGRFNIIPEVAKGAHLVSRGPYRWVRHPMYTSVLLITAASLLNHPGLWRGLAWLALLLVLWVKMQCEERFLLERFPAYPSYREKTRRLIPFIF